MSTTSLGGAGGFGTLQRGTHLPSVPEEMETKAREGKGESSEVSTSLCVCVCMYYNIVIYMYSIGVYELNNVSIRPSKIEY